MRVVLDTNVLVSGLLWLGPPHRILELVDAGELTLCMSENLLQELEEVLRRSKFRTIIARRQTTVDELMSSVVSAAEIFEPTELEPMEELRDRDDIQIFECALSADTEYVISGDEDLLVLKKGQGIPIVTPTGMLEIVEKRRGRVTRLALPF